MMNPLVIKREVGVLREVVDDSPLCIILETAHISASA